jgi:hypothetical protein
MLCTHRKEYGLPNEFRLSGDFPRTNGGVPNIIKGFNMNESVAKIAKPTVGTYLLRRAHYFSEVGHQAPSVDAQDMQVMPFRRKARIASSHSEIHGLKQYT